MATIRKAYSSEIQVISRILAPAFEDKVMAVIGNEEKALKIIPTIVRSINGSIFVAENESLSGEIVGAIIISISEFKFSLPIVFPCLKVLGIHGSLHAFRMVRDYLESEPKKLNGEGRLEAVGVLDNHRGKGLGRELVITGEEFLREQGMEYFGLGVKTENTAYRLYIALGFEEVIRYQNSLGKWIYMRKRLV